MTLAELIALSSELHKLGATSFKVGAKGSLEVSFGAKPKDFVENPAPRNPVQAQRDELMREMAAMEAWENLIEAPAESPFGEPLENNEDE